jgi:release factor glutamine methyltransferase
MNLVRTFYKIFWLPIYRYKALRYVRETRIYEYAGVKLYIPPEVFHPGIYFSTPIFIDFLKKENFQGKKTLDIGTGSGLIAIFTAQKGAIAMAIDINPKAVETTLQNAQLNAAQVAVLESDIFDKVEVQKFDYLLINPPYYPKKPANLVENAFFAGENLEYFEKLFSSMKPYLAFDSKVWMILSEDCDLKRMSDIAQKYDFSVAKIHQRKHWGEELFVAEVKIK